MNPKEMECYQKIYLKLLNSIQINKRQQQKMIFRVPIFFMGNNYYNLKNCIAFIIKKMRDKKYVICYKSPNYIVVSSKQIFSSKKSRTQKKVIINDPVIVDIITKIQRYST